MGNNSMYTFSCVNAILCRCVSMNDLVVELCQMRWFSKTNNRRDLLSGSDQCHRIFSPYNLFSPEMNSINVYVYGFPKLGTAALVCHAKIGPCPKMVPPHYTYTQGYCSS